MGTLVLGIYQRKDVSWLLVWIGGLGTLWLWDQLFLNSPALSRIQIAFANTLVTGLLVVVFSLLLGWVTGISIHALEHSGSRILLTFLTLILNVIRSIPQIILVLIGYVLMMLFFPEGYTHTESQLLWIAVIISLAVFLSVTDTVKTRLDYFRALDFVDAMLCCGISQNRILNVEILWKNSRGYLLHTMIEVFGICVFLQCSIDFIVSVGLSTEVTLSNIPLTLGSLLASLDSKQDILAVSNLWSNPLYFPSIAVSHLQGISVALCIVFTLLCVYNIANGYRRRHRLT